MAYAHISVVASGRVMTLTIQRPEVMNALHSEACAEMHDAFDAFARDPELWVAVVTGAGDRAFCAGNDLKAHAARGGYAMPPSGFGGLVGRFDLDKPVIAAVNGVAAGGGFEIALACDLIVASGNAVFALPEPRVGLAALGGGLLRLSRQIPLKQAMGMILTGEAISARQAQNFGLVNELTPQGGALQAAYRWADKILACSPMAVRASKQTIRRAGEEPDLAAAMHNQKSYPAVVDLLASGDAREGPRAFAEKRPPLWRNR